MKTCRSGWPPRLVTVPGLHGSEGAHWQTWLERQYPKAARVVQDDWDAPHLDTWANAVRTLLASERAPVVIAAHSFGCLATAHALSRGDLGADVDVVGVLFVAPGEPGEIPLRRRVRCRARSMCRRFSSRARAIRGCRSSTRANSRVVSTARS